MRNSIFATTIVTLLAWSAAARALPPSGGLIGSGGGVRLPPPPPPTTPCASLAQGTVTANPDTLDRRTDPNLQTTLTWSATPPSNCPGFTGFTLAQQLLSGSSGTVLTDGPITADTTFSLVAQSTSGEYVIATTTVKVLGVPGPATLSDGPAVTAADIDSFDQHWLQPFEQVHWQNDAHDYTSIHNGAAAWGTGPRMTALVRMYEVTKQPRYLDELVKIIQIVLGHRDDCPLGTDLIHNDTCTPVTDQYRQRVMPAWSDKGPNSGGYDHADLVVTSLYAYPIAAFARVVLEDPSLMPTYGAEAIRDATLIAQSVESFLPQMRTRPYQGLPEGYIAQPDAVRVLLTPEACQQAYDAAVAADPNGNLQRYNQMKSNCNNQRLMAGLPFAQNQELAFSMVLIELYRALGSPAYPRLDDNYGLHDRIPVLVARQQRYFAHFLEPVGTRYFWDYEDDLPPEIGANPEDTSHGSLDMSYFDLLRRNIDFLNPPATALGEPILFDSSQVDRFANTFLQEIAAGRDLASDVSGRVIGPIDKHDGNCDDWVSLASADVAVYDQCRDVSLRVVDGWQPYLNVSNHSALLANKHYLPAPRPPLPPRLPPPRLKLP